MALTVRLDPKTERALDAAARRRRLSRSDVVREAIAAYGAADADRRERSTYDEWVDVIGIVSLADRPGGATTGERFTAVVRDKARARRSR